MRPHTNLTVILLPLIAFMLVPNSARLLAGEDDRVQSRPHGIRVSVPVESIRVDDGDTLQIAWKSGETETVRILGIDTPETRHVEHGIPFDQPFSREASAFVRGVFAMAEKVELLRASTVDPYDRTLGYVFVNDRNYSVLVISARLAAETVSHFGDNGLPEEAAACLDAASKAGPIPFEPPYMYRKRMREVSSWMQTRGLHQARE